MLIWSYVHGYVYFSISYLQFLDFTLHSIFCLHHWITTADQTSLDHLLGIVLVLATLGTAAKGLNLMVSHVQRVVTMRWCAY